MLFLSSSLFDHLVYFYSLLPVLLELHLELERLLFGISFLSVILLKCSKSKILRHFGDLTLIGTRRLEFFVFSKVPFQIVLRNEEVHQLYSVIIIFQKGLLGLCSDSARAFLFFLVETQVYEFSLEGNLRIFQDRLHVFQQDSGFVIFKEVNSFVGSFGQDFLGNRILVANAQEFVGIKAQHKQGLVIVRVIKVAKLIWLVQKDGDVTKIATLLNGGVFIHTLLVHQLDLSCQDEIYVSAHLATLFNHRYFLLFFYPVWGTLILHGLSIFLGKEFEGRITKYLPLKVISAVLKDLTEYLIEIFENGIEHLDAKSWL